MLGGGTQAGSGVGDLKAAAAAAAAHAGGQRGAAAKRRMLGAVMGVWADSEQRSSPCAFGPCRLSLLLMLPRHIDQSNHSKTHPYPNAY